VRLTCSAKAQVACGSNHTDPRSWPCSQAYVGIQCGGQAPQQGNGGLGAALFDALDLVGRHLRAPGQVSDAEAKGAALVVDSLAEGQGLADGDPLRILGLFGRANPAGVVAGHHTCLS